MNLTWELIEEIGTDEIHFYCDGKFIHSGPVTQRHQAKIVYWLVVQHKMTIREARNIWSDMVNKQGLPPYRLDRPYLPLPKNVKFCECGHFLYEHAEPSDFRSKFGDYVVGCLKCGCKEFKQFAQSEETSANLNKG